MAHGIDIITPEPNRHPLERPEPDDGPALGEIGLDAFVPYLMNRVMGCWNGEIRNLLRAHDLTTAQMRALAVLSVRRGLSIHELAHYTVIEPSTMSRTLDALEARGLVRRGPRPKDGRAREIALTEAGTAAFDRFWPDMRAAYGRLLDGIDEAEREAFVSTLRKIARNASAPDGTHD